MRIAPRFAVLVSLALVAPVVTSSPVSAAGKQTITISAPKTIIQPASLTIRGTVTNAKKGQRVVLTRGRGRRVGSAALDAHLAYKFTVKEFIPGRYVFHATSPSGVTSRSVTVLFLHWQYLSDLVPSVNSDSANCGAGAVMGGKTFAHSCTITATTGIATHVEVRVQHVCSKFRGTLGVTDNSASEADATLSVTGDTKSLYTHTYARGASTQLLVDITHRDMLDFDALQLQSASGTVHVALGNAEILCNTGMTN